MIALRSLISFIGRNRSYLTLVVLAVTAAGLWAELKATVATAERICAAARSAYEVDEGKPGEACVREVIRLAAFKADAQDKTAEMLIALMHARDEKQARDAERRQARLEARLAAHTAMQNAEEEVHDDQVRGSWFAALNRLAGLRAPAR